MKIYLARHGQDEDNSNGILNGHRDTPLTALGLDQAKTLAEIIRSKNLGITKIYSSPLRRAYTTAETVANVLGLALPEKLDLLIERDFGVMTGKPVKDIEKLCAPDILKANPITYFLSPEGAETFPRLMDRARELLAFLRNQKVEGTILLVAHGDIGKMVYAAFYGLPWREVLLGFHFGNSEVLLLSENAKLEERHIHKVEQFNH